jgi:hypothetical protein
VHLYKQRTSGLLKGQAENCPASKYEYNDLMGKLKAAEAYAQRFQWERSPKERARRIEGIASVRVALSE